MVTPAPVRTERGPLHMCKPTGHGYLTACGRHLHGEDLVVAPRWRWAHVWSLERVCKRCERLAERAADEAELAHLAGWA